MNEICILERESFNIKLEKQKSIFNVNLTADVKYNENGFNEFLEYFKYAWLYIKNENSIYYLFINLGESKKENELPLTAYVKLIKIITEINDIILKHCHCICILTEGSEKWEQCYNLITRLWSPPEKRPIKFTQCIDEVDLFFKSNKIIN